MVSRIKMKGEEEGEGEEEEERNIGFSSYLCNKLAVYVCLCVCVHKYLVRNF